VSNVHPRSVEHEGRTFTVPAATVALDQDERLALAIVTGSPFDWGGERIAYDLSPGAVDLSLVHAGRCPLLVDHLFLLSSFVGAVTRVSVRTGELRCLCRFARGGYADDVWRLLAQGFPLSISAGGRIEHAEQGADGVLRALRWKLAEVSVCVSGRDQAASITKAEEQAASELLRDAADDPAGINRRVALRKRLHLDDWTRWVGTAGPRLARTLGVPADEATDALAELVREQVHAIEGALA
jgi:hypothetical protein